MYAVRAGYRPGLYYSWEECRNQVHGYSGAEFRGFSTVEEARDYLSGRWNPPNNKDRKRHNNTHQPIRQQQQQQSFAPAHYSDSYSDDDSDTYSDYSDDDYGHGRVEYTGYAVEVPSVVYRVGLAQAVGPRSTPPSRQPAGLAQVSGARAAAPAHHHVGHVARASGTQSASAPVIVHTCGIAIAGPVAGNSGRAVATNAPRRQATGGVARRGESLASRKNVYAVRAGYKPGLYYSWEECRKQVHGFSRAEFRGFNTVDEAREYLSGRWNPPSNKDQKRAQQGHHQQRPAAAAAAAAPPAYNSDSDDSSDEYWEYDDEDRSVTQWLRVCPREARGKEPRTHPSSAARTSRAEAMFMAQAMQLLDYELESEARQDRAAERWPEEDQMRNRRDQDEYDILAYIGRELDTLDYPDAPPRMRRTISELLDFMKYRADELRGYKARTTYGVFHQSSGPRLSSSPSSLCR